ncbi:MAG: transposase [Thermoleophilia bacterium]|nr:transposase [Thermoleophilia bacterium]
MDLHANAVLTVRQRQRVCDLVAAGVTITAAALVVGCSRQTASKWVGRKRRGEGLGDRSSRPHRSPRQTPQVIERAILRARAELREGPHVIGWALGMAASTVHAVLRRHGCSRLVSKPPAGAIVRYERSRPGPRQGRLAVPVRGDRRSLETRLRRHLPRRDERECDLLPRRARLLLWSARHPRRARAQRQRRLLQALRWAEACAAHGIAVRKTRAYRPQTNGKAERFIRTLLERWAYAYSYEHESQRLAALSPALDFYNRFRPHRALHGLTPLQRVNNLPGTYI